MSAPSHIAMIMDGNGRWAASRSRPRNFGHLKGARVAREIIKACAQRNVKFLTLYAFSTENWLRPKDEVSFLMMLLERSIKRERKTLIENQIRFRVIGSLDQLPSGVRNEILKSIEITAENSGMTLTFAINYGGRREITDAVKGIVSDVRLGRLKENEIDESTISERLASSFLPDPDLVIRTSGEFRTSNFLLWQSAYSEYFILEKPWPEFTVTELDKALMAFSQRERRFGKISSQIKARSPAIEPNEAEL